MIQDVQPVININCSTSFNDSSSLFDYKQSKVMAKQFTFPLTTKTVSIYRERSYPQLIAKKDDQDVLDEQKYQLLLKLQIDHQFQQNQPKVKINIWDDSDFEEQAYFVINKIKDKNGSFKGCKLLSGQTIKLGKQLFYVSQIPSNLPVSCNSSKTQSKVTQIKDNSEKKSADICRNCFEGESQQNKLISNICKCKGQIGTLHQKCFIIWHQKYAIKKGNQNIIQHRDLKCDVCKSNVTIFINSNNKVEKVTDRKPQINQIVLKKMDTKQTVIINIKEIPFEGIKIGRGNQCEVRTKQISVSEIHAIIKKINGQFYIFDLKSKYGTLVRHAGMGFQLGEQSYGLQVGRTMFTMEMKNQK